MTIKSRLSKLEAKIDPAVCPLCGARKLSDAERQRARDKAESLVTSLQQEKGFTRVEALAYMCDHAPTFMRQARLTHVIPEGCCKGCGAREQPISEQQLKEQARELFARYTEELGDEVAALALFRQDAPTLAAYLH